MSPAARVANILALSLFAFSTPADAGKRKKKNKGAPPPPVGWHQAETWGHACYYAPNFEELAGMARRDAGMDGFDAIMSQWRGQREDGISFSESVIDDVELIVLATPAKAERLFADNLAACQNSAQGLGDSEWHAWVRGLPAKLTEGECHQSLSYTVFQWLEITDTWQEEHGVCPGDHIRITASSKDRYRVSEGGPWITAAGDPERSTVGMDGYPCARDGCLKGMLLLRYVSDNGMEQIFPVGTEFIYEIPEKGTISYQINDATFYDNIWYQTGGLIDKTAIEISPVK